LCIFPEEEDSDIKCQFDHNMLWRRVRTMTELGNAKGAVNFMSLDRGWSDTRFADFSCAVVGRVQPVDGRQALVVVDAKLERARESEVIKDMLVPLIALHKPRVLIFEEDRGWKDFEESLRRALVLRNIIVPWLRHVPIDTSPRSKSIRVKALELPIHSGRMYFNAAIPDLEICLGQLERFDGTTNSNSHRKDDFPDSLAILADACLPKTHEEVAKEDPKEAQQRKDREEVEFERERRQAYHDRMHGGPSQPEQEQPPPQTPAPVYRPPTAMGNGFATLPGNMRGNPNKR